MQYAQAIHVLRKMQSAAPPTASARLGDVIALLVALYDENTALKTAEFAPAPPAPPPPNALDPLFLQALEILIPALTVVQAQVNGVRAGKLGRVNQEQDGALALAEQQADAVSTLLDSLDVLTKLRLGALDIHLEPMDGADAINRAWGRVSLKAESRGHQMAMRLDDPLPRVIGDKLYVAIVLSDLMENAILYTPYGGVIRLTADTLGTHVLFGVEDNGVGLTPDDHIGEAFWRGETNALVRQHRGAGLRLYLARQLLQMMGGELFFSGEPGEGSTFSFTLPAAR